ncbi:MAG: cold shock domain-containing protein [Algibacter sp.]|uniref:cold-shock protein n=1 Tax=Algibacter sp. TaxID=1872428 RepID=UPI00262D8C78|nr:cold shock domain-containing protein [Algibacter sp.]MDG1730830.1 cold shock domain-containing protein [Algibacter sp.]MDG2179332.1 cold shock domain-containing protein [Algibacter sp.]
MIKNFINKLFNRSKETDTKTGKVKFFNYKKGYGFITVKDSNEEIFVHTKNIIDKIREKDHVTFKIEKSPKGPIATNVRVVKK